VIRFGGMISKKRSSHSPLLIILLALLPIQATELSVDMQKVLSFADHLFQTEDYLRAAIEYERYLYLSNSTADSILFKIGLCHQFRNRPDYAIRAFEKIARKQSSPIMKSARLAIIYNLYLEKNWQRIHEIGYQNDAEFFFYYLANLQCDSVAIKPAEITQINDDSLRSVITNIDKRYQQLQPKSPFVAALLSTVLPGLGKVYIKRPGDALYAFGMTGFAGLIAWKAFQADLLVTGIITSGITLSFYLGTIYGSYVGTHLYNEDINIILIAELERFNPVTRNPYWLPWLQK
jgi:tetratricopeptide (TPR) repeat protein